MSINNKSKSKHGNQASRTAAPIKEPVSASIPTVATSSHGSGGHAVSMNHLILYSILNKVETYDGEGDVRPWIEDVRVISENLQEMDKRTLVQLSLKGHAKDWLRNQFGVKLHDTPFDTILNELEKHFIDNISVRDVFYQISETLQSENERVSHYITRMQTMWRKTGREFGVEFNDLLIKGTKNKIRKQLRRLPHNCSLQEIKNKAMEAEREIEHSDKTKSKKKTVFNIEEKDVENDTSESVSKKDFQELKDMVFQIAENSKRKPDDNKTSTYNKRPRTHIKSCNFCHKRGHEESQCWTKDPSKRPNYNKHTSGSSITATTPSAESVNVVKENKI
jgi:hypothetical protein